MSPLRQDLDTVDSEHGDDANLTDMRRVSMALAFSPARQRRREKMGPAARWFRSRTGLGGRRHSRTL